MANEFTIEKRYKLPKKLFGRFPENHWEDMLSDINSDIDYPEANLKIINFLTQLKPIFEGGNPYTIKVFKTTGVPFVSSNKISTFNIEIYLDKQRIVEFDYFPLRSDGLPSVHPYYEFWIDSQLINKKLKVKKLYHFNDDYKIEFVNDIFFNSNYKVDEENERILINIKTQVQRDGKKMSVVGILYDFETLCQDLINEPKKVAHALYFKNNEVSYDDFIKNEKDSHAIAAMINI